MTAPELVPFECPAHGWVADAVPSARVQHGWVGRMWCGKECKGPAWVKGVAKNKAQKVRRDKVRHQTA